MFYNDKTVLFATKSRELILLTQFDEGITSSIFIR